MSLSYEMLEAVASPQVDVQAWYDPMNAAVSEFGLHEDPRLQAGFLANVAHETGGLLDFEENLNYRWDVLLAQWPNRFTAEAAIEYGRVRDTVTQGGQKGVVYRGRFYPTRAHSANQPAIANIAYGGRYGNNNEGDGWRYRGRGAFQLTFYDNYMAFANDIGEPDLVNYPDVVAQDPLYVCRSAAHYWNSKGLSRLMLTRGIEAVGRAINGGTIGMADRVAHYNHLLQFT